MKASELLIEKIKEFEGYSSTAYKCAGGVATIAWGHTRGVRMGDRCTKSEGERSEEHTTENHTQSVRGNPE